MKKQTINKRKQKKTKTILRSLFCGKNMLYLPHQAPAILRFLCRKVVVIWTMRQQRPIYACRMLEKKTKIF